jgi:hypothetical protein
MLEYVNVQCTKLAKERNVILKNPFREPRLGCHEFCGDKADKPPAIQR